MVTGGASGIGKATVEMLAEAGAHVLIGDLDEQNGTAVVAAIRENGQGADVRLVAHHNRPYSAVANIGDRRSIEE